MRSSLLFYCCCPHFAIAPISQKSEIEKFQKVDPHFLPRFFHGSNQNFFIIIYQNSVLAGPLPPISNGGGSSSDYKKQKPPDFFGGSSSGAGYEARTRYLHLGKVALYQMS